MQDQGDEYGASTGRPRRCGWLDLVVLRHTARINGVNKIAVTKLDVLDNFEEINVCVGYELNGQKIDQLPLDFADLISVKPIYRTFPGWMCTTTGLEKFDLLPPNAQEYLNFIAADLDVLIGLVSTGAKREETIMV